VHQPPTPSATPSPFLDVKNASPQGFLPFEILYPFEIKIKGSGLILIVGLEQL
jgi:hypothetical protein